MGGGFKDSFHLQPERYTAVCLHIPINYTLHLRPNKWADLGVVVFFVPVTDEDFAMKRTILRVSPEGRSEQFIWL